MARTSTRARSALKTVPTQQHEDDISVEEKALQTTLLIQWMAKNSLREVQGIIEAVKAQLIAQQPPHGGHTGAALGGAIRLCETGIKGVDSMRKLLTDELGLALPKELL
ncbi:MAG: hypothetical protein KIS79_07855 [Burkholderiales bacterium]|nr:hypothetical protein [Burkholderiales bacterium]